MTFRFCRGTRAALAAVVFSVTGVVARGATAAAPDIDTSAVLRLQAVSWQGLPFGPTNFVGDEDVLLVRALGDLALTWPTGPKALIEIGYHEQTGRRLGTLPTDSSSIDLHLAYLDAPFGSSSFLRVGRQHFLYAKQRIFSLRDGTNLRRSFDGALLDAQANPFRVRAFALRPVRAGRNAFDDSADRTNTVLGAIATFMPLPARGIDAYVLDFDRKRSFYRQGVGGDRRQTLGVRLFDDSAPLEWDLEAAWQRGHFEDKRISAWMVAGEVARAFPRVRWAPRLGLRANVTSGDDDPSDGTLETFNSFYPVLYGLAQASILHPSNYADIQPRLTLQLSKTVSLLTRVNWSWRMHQDDAIYIGGPLPLAAGAGGNFIARQVDLELTWKPRASFEVHLGYTRMTVGRALSDIGATDLDLFVLMTTNRF